MSTAIAPLASLPGTEQFAPASARASVKSGVETVPADTAPPQVPLGPNPSFRIDEALGIIVMQLHDASGEVASTIPTAQQLNAYRRAVAHAGVQPAPVGTGQAATALSPPAAGTAATPAAASGPPGSSATAQASAAPTASPGPSALTNPGTA